MSRPDFQKTFLELQAEYFKKDSYKIKPRIKRVGLYYLILENISFCYIYFTKMHPSSSIVHSNFILGGICVLHDEQLCFGLPKAAIKAVTSEETAVIGSAIVEVHQNRRLLWPHVE